MKPLSRYNFNNIQILSHINYIEINKEGGSKQFLGNNRVSKNAFIVLMNLMSSGRKKLYDFTYEKVNFILSRRYLTKFNTYEQVMGTAFMINKKT